MPITWVRSLLVCTLLAAAAACSDSSSPTGPTPIPAPDWPVRISLQEHESQAVPQTDLTITLDEVQLLATSCLPNVPCPAFLAGVTIGVRAANDAARRTTFYAYDDAPPANLRAVHHGYVVRFAGLTPAIGRAAPGEPYRVELEIAPEGAGPR
jgi:hypothetical protein